MVGGKTASRAAVGAAAALGVTLVGLSGAYEAKAESPPSPPARFAGSVKVDGAAPAAGTRIEARIGSSTCGLATAFNASGESRYALDSPALDPGATPNCGTDGAVVSFWIGDRKAAETGVWHNYQLNIVNLTYTTPPPTPSATASPSATPRPPVTGSGVQAGNGSSSFAYTFAGLGAAALALGVGGLSLARRKR